MATRDEPTNWILGLDARVGAEGPLIFARWLSESIGRQTVAKLEPIHVLEPSELEALASVDKAGDGLSLARAAVAETIERAGIQLAPEDVRLVDGDAPEDVLAKAATNADGLVIGRLAPRGDTRFIRLGRVARRLLRRLPTATFVVPPDLRDETIGKGPILFACDARPLSLGGARMAVKLSRLLERELIFVLVAPSPYGWSISHVPPPAYDQLLAGVIAAGERSLERWAKQHGFTAYRGVVASGDPTRELATMARELDALMVVTGSRRLTAVERVFATSVGTELAASASCPVLVVPPSPS